MAETAVFSVMAVLLALGLLTLIPIHRARTISVAAAYVCTQFVSQAKDHERAISQAETIGKKTIDSVWSGTPGVEYEVAAWISGRDGERGCRVRYRAPLLFNGPMQLEESGWREVDFTTRAERWKAEWP